MADLKYTLSGPETVTLAVNTVDKLIRAGDGDAALLYLYILKTHGESPTDETAAALGKTPGGIATAMAVLSRLGLVRINGKDSEKESDRITSGDEAPLQELVPDEPEYDPRNYTIEEIKRELTNGSGFSVVIEEAQRSLGKLLSPDELQRLYGIYDELRLPPEVIMQLITHCIHECRRSGSGRAPSVRYIEKAAYTWSREGVCSFDTAEQYIKTLEQRRSIRGEIKKALNIYDREFSASEKSYVDCWIEMGYRADAIGVAYDRMMGNIGKHSWKYIDKIIRSWHSQGLHTAKEIVAKDGKTAGSGAQYGVAGAVTSEKKFGAPDSAELERMKRLRDKIKGT